ncbi:MAG: hypothetical protein VX699_11655 [Myxococcota bacterium]|nr:hypothetical protein [Myxococcota bacterium]
MKLVGWLLLAGCCGMGLGACAGSRSAPPPAAFDPLPRPELIRLGGTVVRKDKDPLTGRHTYDDETLFHLAGDAERDGKIPRAIELYERLLAEFKEGIYVLPTLFNLGLMSEEAEDFEVARGYYLRLLQGERPGEAFRERIWIRGHFREAVCLGKLQRWWEAVGAFDFVLELEDLDEAYHFEALTGRAISLHEAGDSEAADIAFSKAYRFYRTMSVRHQRDARDLAAETAYRMGEIARARYLGVKLEFPADLMRERLEEKCTHLLSAQGRYLRAIRYGDPSTVAAAGFYMGSLYEGLHDEITDLEVPEELSEEQGAIYREEVADRVRILLEKAIRIYEKVLIAGAQGERGDWAEKIEQALERLKSMYLEIEEG